jgi:hypothetical protein
MKIIVCTTPSLDEGFVGPFYPEELAEVQREYDHPDSLITRNVLIETGKRLNALPAEDYELKTSDGTPWYHKMAFEVKGGIVLFLFLDRSMPRGRERAIEVHGRGTDIDKNECKELFYLFAAYIREILLEDPAVGPVVSFHASVQPRLPLLTPIVVALIALFVLFEGDPVGDFLVRVFGPFDPDHLPKNLMIVALLTLVGLGLVVRRRRA